MEYLKELMQSTEEINEETLEQIVEIVDETKFVDSDLYIIFNELKVFIKDYETFDTRDTIQEIISKIDVLLTEYVNTTVSDKTNVSESEEPEKEQQPETKSRTDKKLISDADIEINQDALDILEMVLTTEHTSNVRLDIFFSDTRCKDINGCWIKDKRNPYTLDAYGLIIRKKCLNKPSSEFGWRYDEFNRPIHIAINDTCTREENINNVLNIQYQKNKKAFDKKGIIYQIYSKIYPERLEKFNVAV